MSIVNKTQKVEKICASNFVLRKIQLAYYKPIVKRELKLLNKDVKNILCIGGGNFPATAILLQKFTKALVTVIDNDNTSIDNAIKLIKKLKLENKVIVKNIDGIEINAADYDMIHIASQISPKDQVLSQIELTKKNDSSIIVRTPKEKFKELYYDFTGKTAKFSKMPFYSKIGKVYLYE